MIKTIIIPVIHTITDFLINRLPDTWKIIIGVFILMCMAVTVLRGIGIDESKAYSNTLQEVNTAKFESMVKYNDAQFHLLRDDIKEIKKQNTEVIKLLINK